MNDIPGLEQLRPALEVIRSAANKVGFDLGEAWNHFVRAVQQPGQPFKLGDAAGIWGRDVKEAVSQGKNTLAQEAKAVQAAWAGQSALSFDRYIQILDAGSFAALQKICEGLDKTLTDEKNALLIWWAAVIAFTAATAAAVATGIAASIPSLGTSLGAVVLALVGWVAAFGAAFLAKQNYDSKQQENYNQWTGLTREQDAFPEGRWPRPSTGVPINDGTPADGNDWKPRN